jgi:hypothetical protein
MLVGAAFSASGSEEADRSGRRAAAFQADWTAVSRRAGLAQGFHGRGEGAARAVPLRWPGMPEEQQQPLSQQLAELGAQLDWVREYL